MQSLWMSQWGGLHNQPGAITFSGWDYEENLQQVDNVDVVQCSIDQPPLRIA